MKKMPRRLLLSRLWAPHPPPPFHLFDGKVVLSNKEQRLDSHRYWTSPDVHFKIKNIYNKQAKSRPWPAISLSLYIYDYWCLVCLNSLKVNGYENEVWNLAGFLSVIVLHISRLSWAMWKPSWGCSLPRRLMLQQIWLVWFYSWLLWWWLPEPVRRRWRRWWWPW